jgi:DNA-binding Xre family transcriptional regulator
MALRIERDTLARLYHTLACTTGDLLVLVGGSEEAEQS